MHPPASLDPPPAGATRVRPFIYVYDVDTMYTSRMMQYRIAKGAVTWRQWQESNVSITTDNGYSLETLFHELLLQVRALLCLFYVRPTNSCCC